MGTMESGENLGQSVTETWRRASRNLQGSFSSIQMKRNAEEGTPVAIPKHKAVISDHRQVFGRLEAASRHIIVVQRQRGDRAVYALSM